jgi:hypothetical protein
MRVVDHVIHRNAVLPLVASTGFMYDVHIKNDVRVEGKWASQVMTPMQMGILMLESRRPSFASDHELNSSFSLPSEELIMNNIYMDT